jgi:hypothetical protein
VVGKHITRKQLIIGEPKLATAGARGRQP